MQDFIHSDAHAANFLISAQNQMQTIIDRLLHLDQLDSSGGSLSVRIPDRSKLFAMTPTHAGFEGWNLAGLVVVNDKLEKHILSNSPKKLHPSAVVHGHIYVRFPAVNAIIHTHAPFSLAFACQKLAIKPVTLHAKIIGGVPCLESDADEMADRHCKTITAIEEDMTSGMRGYRYALNHFNDLLDQITEIFEPRKDELLRHGLAFTVYRHGIFVMARNLAEAHDNLTRVERNAQVQLLIRG